MGRCKPLHSRNSFLSYAPQISGAKSCLLVYLKEWQMTASCISSAPQQSMVHGGICWITILGTLIHIWRPGSADGCDISHLLIRQEIFSFHTLCGLCCPWPVVELHCRAGAACMDSLNTWDMGSGG